jgi:hypothetical protein
LEISTFFRIFTYIKQQKGIGYLLNLQNKMVKKLTFNENTYEFHYYEPNGKPAFNIQKNGEITKFNLIWDNDGDNAGFNIYEEVRYQHNLVSLTYLKKPFNIIDMGTIFKEIKLKTGINL